MAKATPKISLNQSENIPYDRLVLSQKNVRRIKDGVTIEDLAEDIALRGGLIQSLNVRPLRDENGEETGQYEVPAGGRRFLALGILIKQKRMAKDQPTPCIVNRKETTSADDDSLAENMARETLHPLDEFRAFKVLFDQGLGEEEIAARYKVAPATVKQRLRLADVSPKLLDLYGKGELKLEQVKAFSITSDHARQEDVWATVSRSTVQEPYYIKRLLTETAVRADDRRAVYIGAAAYEAAGGIILRDLFQQDGGGWFQDPALLEKLVLDKLEADAEAVRAEGWKWVVSAIDFGYGHTSGMRRVYGEPAELSEEELARQDALQEEYEKLDAEYAESPDYDEETEKKLATLGDAIDVFNDRPDIYDPDEVARAGAFVTLDANGELRIERGFVRSEDEAPVDEDVADVEAAAGHADGDRNVGERPGANGAAVSSGDDEEDTIRPLPDRLILDLTAHRTLALRNALAQDPDTAYVAVLHALVLQVFFHNTSDTCIGLTVKNASFGQVEGLGQSIWAKEIDQRHENWGKDLPKSPDDLWPFLLALDPASRQALFGHCAVQGLNAVIEPWAKRPGAIAHADEIARTIGFDMAEAGWQPTPESYLARVTKRRILEAVREACGEEQAYLMEDQPKAKMVTEAARVLNGTGWLPEVLRLDDLVDVDAPQDADADIIDESAELPAYLSDGAEQDDSADPAETMQAAE
ncbi:ParB/RepB/Spo0J family partition protein [Chelativorans sp. AA-79]|uniref:ParB/RepB/Spo0J family partition protein n=1 Tax=Chelativorans sp. AA-79 TaxID=3028735 RepID=UPI0023F8B778|nr:ParB/RepB/Spo0J family partition protein [Chelativorans sp. AA-79]WEX12378.1 ParB N-terminal domain-containing protein [Chelativorans sp. AA-79]